jgi:hypothetical protein
MSIASTKSIETDDIVDIPPPKALRPNHPANSEFQNFDVGGLFHPLAWKKGSAPIWQPGAN